MQLARHVSCAPMTRLEALIQQGVCESAFSFALREVVAHRDSLGVFA